MMRVEEWIKYKAYHELSVEELDMIKDMATNEKEYEQLKQFLGQTALYVQDQKIVASENLQEKFMHELHGVEQVSTSWRHSFFTFLFPTEKPWYQYPAIQFTGLALLLFGLFNLFESPIQKQELAVNSKVEEVLLPNKIVENSERTVLDSSSVFFPDTKLTPPETELEKIAVSDDLANKSKLAPIAVENFDIAAEAPRMISTAPESDEMEDDLAISPSLSLEKDAEASFQDLEEVVTTTDYNEVSSGKESRNQLKETSNAVSLENVVVANVRKKRDKSNNAAKVLEIVYQVKEIMGLSDLFYEVK
ncbi:hypothetical protein DNU06_12680 [Putridiphycobacter roseus]|uniref:Uncharacterized protein n=1 Tax=Putridiphycobacter roseus TaxID=2219161 RepID=A0A2W1MYU1_9FLAO|nr:hypothetical protein [Putridiphycobacter roseus]PZE16400.1 hypothetical protein DNU06_12680 [Putridiphycobacter roseus]